MKLRLSILFVAMALLLSSCGFVTVEKTEEGSSQNSSQSVTEQQPAASEPTQENTAKPIVNIKEIAGKSSEDIVKVLGEPKKKESIKLKVDGAKVPGEGLRFDGIDVWMHENKAVKVVISPKDTPFPKDPKDVLRLIGLPAENPTKTNDTMSFWDDYEGIHKIETMNKDGKINYITVTLDKKYK